MKNAYEIRLEQLLREYNLEYRETSDSMHIHRLVMEMFETRCKGKKVALWGAGRKNTENSHAAIIIKKYTTYIQGLDCLIDSLPELRGDMFMGYPIISPDDLENRKPDIVIIASKVQADSIIKQLHEKLPGCEYIDIYGELAKQGIKVYHKFYEESNIYTSLYQMRKEYEQKKNVDSLKNIIRGYLSIQDFYYAELFAKEYIGLQLEDYDQIKDFFEKLHLLIGEVQKVNCNKKEDIAIFFVDSLRAMDVFHKETDGTYRADMLKPYAENGVVFTNAKSTGVTTYESMVSVTKGKYPFEINVYDNNIMADFDEFKLLPVAKELGYDINFYVTEGYQIINDCEDVKFEKQVYLSSKLWKVATDMACSTNKTFNFTYVPYELHFPLICGYHEMEPRTSGFVDVGIVDTKDFVPRQLEECKAYVDKQFEYYDSWYSKEMLFSIFADHSQVVYDEAEQKPYFMYHNNQDRCVNVTFIIRGFGLQQKWCEDLVSLYDFCDIFGKILKDKELYVPNRDIALYQYYKIHYRKLREYAIDKGLEDYIDGIQCFTSKDYMYVVTATGKEAVYKLENSTTNIICDNDGIAFKQRVLNEYKVEFPSFILER